MAKSTRSKVKRHFRAKKREQGVYAAAEAARLHRLHQKLKTVAMTDKEGDVEVEDAPADDEQSTEMLGEPTGWYWSTYLGLETPDGLTPERLGCIAQLFATWQV